MNISTQIFYSKLKNCVVFLDALDNGKLKITLSCVSDWSGTLVFDSPRYKDKMNFPFDYPRINQYQQCLTIDAQKEYFLKFGINGNPKILKGRDLINGLPISIKHGETILLTVN